MASHVDNATLTSRKLHHSQGRNPAMTIILLYFVFRPRIEVGAMVRKYAPRPEPTSEQLDTLRVAMEVEELPSPGWIPGARYLVRYRNVGWLPVYDLRITARVKFLLRGYKQTSRSVEIPMSSSDQPILKGSSRLWMTPRLLLAHANWPRAVAPDQ